MTWFSLPKRQANNTAAFFDADGASRWLSTQPQANAALMVAELLRQIEALNGFSIPARERFKILEVLRKSVFSASGESSRRYENKPLPLLPAEQLAFETARRLWRAFALAYLHCLRACLDGDRALLAHSARVAHRVLASAIWLAANWPQSSGPRCTPFLRPPSNSMCNVLLLRIACSVKRLNPPFVASIA